jgi:hypothetical protein
MEAVGLEITIGDPVIFEKLPDDIDLVAWIRSANVHRRHLDKEWRDDYLAGKIKANPKKSNRAIAAEAAKDGIRVDHKKVAREREQLESTGAVAPVEETTGQDGRTRKKPAAKKGKNKNTAAIETKPAPEITLTAAEYKVEADPPVVGPEPAPETKSGPTLHCSFCDKSQHEVHKLIVSSPAATVSICNECVELAWGIIRDGISSDRHLTVERVTPLASAGYH